MILAHINGHLGTNAEIKTSAAGKPFARFSLASSDSKKNHKGQWEKTTTWINVITFKQGLFQYLKKGCKVSVSGKMSADAYISQTTGQLRPQLDLRATELEMLSFPKTDQQHAYQPSPTPEPVSELPPSDPF